MKAVSKFIIKLLGWKLNFSVVEEPKSVVCLAPHTSAWDFFYSKLGCSAAGWTSSFLMKKEMFFFPFGPVLRWMGGVPVFRSEKRSLTDQMADEFNKREHFHLGICPEGTRSYTEEWKLGFYYIAIKAKAPIQLAYLDYEKKEMGVGMTFYPTGDSVKDLAEIRAFYKNIKGKKPEFFYASQE